MQGITKKLYDAIIAYYSCKITNYSFEKMLDDCYGFSNIYDNIINTLYLLYDDTREHVWFVFYNLKLQNFLSLWIFLLTHGDLLNNLVDFNFICPKKNLEHYWDSVYYFCCLKKNIIDYFPIAGKSCLIKYCLTKPWFIPQKYAFLHCCDIMKDIIKLRKHEIIVEKWKGYGVNWNDFFILVSRKQCFDDDLLFFVLPEDCILFYLKENWIKQNYKKTSYTISSMEYFFDIKSFSRE